MLFFKRTPKPKTPSEKLNLQKAQAPVFLFTDCLPWGCAQLDKALNQVLWSLL